MLLFQGLLRSNWWCPFLCLAIMFWRILWGCCQVQENFLGEGLSLLPRLFEGLWLKGNCCYGLLKNIRHTFITIPKMTFYGSEHGLGTQKDCFILYSLDPFIQTCWNLMTIQRYYSMHRMSNLNKFKDSYQVLEKNLGLFLMIKTKFKDS